MGKGKAAAAATFSGVNIFLWVEAAALGLGFPSRVPSRIRNYTNFNRIKAIWIRYFICSYYDIYIIYIFMMRKKEMLFQIN